MYVEWKSANGNPILSLSVKDLCGIRSQSWNSFTAVQFINRVIWTNANDFHNQSQTLWAP